METYMTGRIWVGDSIGQSTGRRIFRNVCIGSWRVNDFSSHVSHWMILWFSYSTRSPLFMGLLSCTACCARRDTMRTDTVLPQYSEYTGWFAVRTVHYQNQHELKVIPCCTLCMKHDDPKDLWGTYEKTLVRWLSYHPLREVNVFVNRQRLFAGHWRSRAHTKVAKHVDLQLGLRLVSWGQGSTTHNENNSKQNLDKTIASISHLYHDMRRTVTPVRRIQVARKACCFTVWTDVDGSSLCLASCTVE